MPSNFNDRSGIRGSRLRDERTSAGTNLIRTLQYDLA